VGDSPNHPISVPNLPQGYAPPDDRWRCRRCGSVRWVAASLTGPVDYGGRAIKQCVPCGHYSSDPAAPDG
jgi:hypothetical protein